MKRCKDKRKDFFRKKKTEVKKKIWILTYEMYPIDKTTSIESARHNTEGTKYPFALCSVWIQVTQYFVMLCHRQIGIASPVIAFFFGIVENMSWNWFDRIRSHKFMFFQKTKKNISTRNMDIKFHKIESPFSQVYKIQKKIEFRNIPSVQRIWFRVFGAN